MATVLMSIEGVLTESLPPDSDLMHYESSNAGKILYGIFRDTTRLVLLSRDSDKDRVRGWLARERFSRYADIHCYPIDTLLSPPLWRVQHTKDLIGIGHHVSFFVDSDPTTVGMVLESGVDALLVARSGSTPGYRPDDMGYQPWYSLVETIEQQTMVRAARSLEGQDG